MTEDKPIWPDGESAQIEVERTWHNGTWTIVSITDVPTGQSLDIALNHDETVELIRRLRKDP